MSDKIFIDIIAAVQMCTRWIGRLHIESRVFTGTPGLKNNNNNNKIYYYYYYYYYYYV